ncbi:aminotransferase class V-fold PLP-dependent enzyme [Marinomonas sp. M1K-6]|uniref:Aminotransferase class V-fold PLP-dependent enzyme n=1 Tax=Marinomonas profundi TaxID=2726122 RepID=A0A847R6Z8_9GAMM|nr:aminotransferase class V-fold PLP-dependent enzyme [Marinomonas profundi]NLQ16877.1 aminotransferase class V-fold PLP-dependent enzyme [Marinomonas profundi]UDV02609.1 aminotransferase class V-fold PLP-dependent enzyme [Marinomonas profundi]
MSIAATESTLNQTTREQSAKALSNEEALFARIRDGIIGKDTQITTPFGARTLTYADYTASGRSLDFIEDAIRHHVLPLYANTHTEANATGQQTTAFREQARQQIRQAINASTDDLVIFCGSGATSAVNTLISQLGLRQLSESEKANVCVFIGPYEHHSNELPWRELGIAVVSIPESKDGNLCLITLEAQLQANQHKRLIGSFSAASNVTGVLSDQDAITALLHRYNALAFWDFAAAAPYVALDMNPSADQTLAKEAIFFSTHKFIGGPGTPGILVVKKAIISNQKPSLIGGGTVSFVTPEEHTFLPISERREEGGTPSIIESIRAGLVFQLKQTVGANVIEAREHELVQLIDKHWHNHPNIERLGHAEAARLSITAFRINTDFGYLHHGFITALLNDLFGIQVRGGCSCAGPYGHQLLGIDKTESERIQEAMRKGEKLVKPGWVRFNLNYFLDDAEAMFILDAIDFVAKQGLNILPYYAYDQTSDLWRFQGKSTTPKSLNELLFSQTKVQQPTAEHSPNTTEDRSTYLAQAEEIVQSCLAGKYTPQSQPFNKEFNDIKRFVLAEDLV